jgi:alkylated DNA nucleotide flippase Atl1
MIAANAAEESLEEGRNLNIPYWRTLKANGFLNEKYPGGQESQKKLLEKEGFKIISRGKRYQVVDFKKYIVEL